MHRICINVPLTQILSTYGDFYSHTFTVNCEMFTARKYSLV